MRILCLLSFDMLWSSRVSWGRQWINIRFITCTGTWHFEALDEFLTGEVRENSVKILYHVILKCPSASEFSSLHPWENQFLSSRERHLVLCREDRQQCNWFTHRAPRPLTSWFIQHKTEVCTLSPDHIFAQWFSSSVLQSSAFGQLYWASNEVNASGDPLVHLLSLAIKIMCSFISLKERKEDWSECLPVLDQA